MGKDDNVKWIDIGEKMTKNLLKNNKKNMEILIATHILLHNLLNQF